ncbi:MAG: hypothetical protein C4581_00355 [Nitrospiraceae bacterium]|nr:MAG: hypothetical protein C4581_00355 [Nitrospiraceae bacterium]
MGYTNVALKDKVMAMYPEIMKHNISVGLDFSKEKNAFIIMFKKNSHELQTYLDKNDADECMNDIKCVHLGVKIGEFITNFEKGS